MGFLLLKILQMVVFDFFVYIKISTFALETV